MTDFSNEAISAIVNALADPERMSAAQKERTRRLDGAAATQRDLALIQLERAITRQQAASAELGLASDKLWAARAAAEELAPAVAIASAELTQASSATHSAYAAVRQHGGDLLAFGLQRLHAATEQQRTKLELLEANKFSVTWSTDGRPLWRTLQQEIDAQITPAKERLKNLQEAHTEMQRLESARGRSPESLRLEVVACLKRFGLATKDLEPATEQA